MQVLFHLLCDYVTMTPQFGYDTLASVIADMRQQQTTPSTSSATESAHELQPHKAMPRTVTPDAATGTLASTGVTLDSEEHSLTGTGAGLQIQDDLSLASSTEGGVGTGSGSQAMPPAQGAVEREEGDASPHGSGDNAAHGDPQPAPAPHSQDPTLLEPPAEQEGDAADDDVQLAPLCPHARGPRAPSPLPTQIGGLWSQLQQALADGQ